MDAWGLTWRSCPWLRSSESYEHRWRLKYRMKVNMVVWEKDNTIQCLSSKLLHCQYVILFIKHSLFFFFQCVHIELVLYTLRLSWIIYPLKHSTLFGTLRFMHFSLNTCLIEVWLRHDVAFVSCFCFAPTPVFTDTTGLMPICRFVSSPTL